MCVYNYRSFHLTPSLLLLLLLLGVHKPLVAKAKTTSPCPGDCSGNGLCNADTGGCNCFTGYTGHDCGLRSCPEGYQWLGYASATDTLHNTMAECSGAGDCDRNLGTCKCTAPFSGNACERVGCPPTGKYPCNGNGKCMDLKTVAGYKDDIGFSNVFTYSLWDAERVFGCVCDYGYTGYDCSLRTCPFGDDAVAGSSATVDSQTYTCSGSSGSFVARIFGFVTESIAYNANAATIVAALKALPPIGGVSVSFSTGSVVCGSGSAITTTIQWTHVPGDVPQLTFPVNTAGIAFGSTTVDGTSTSTECSSRGLCTRTGASAGLCVCETGFSSSDGTSTNTIGTAGDCSRISSVPSSCTTGSGVTTCNGHGTCSTGSSSSSSTFRQCLCDDDWTGYDCSLRRCPKGKAWWDDPTANDVAHGWAECSNRGLCNRGTGECKCDSGNTGAACDRSICPYVSSTDPTIECNGRGRCMNIKTFNTYREVNGEDSALVYGTDPSSVATWDAELLQTCLCDNNRYVNNQYSWQGLDCAQRTCPRGDDYETATAASGSYQKEIQKITCIATGGTFTLSFRDETTEAIAWNANANGTSTKMSGYGTVTYGSATLVTTVDISSTIAANDVLTLVHNTDASITRSFTVASDSSNAIVMTEPIGIASATLYTIYKATSSVESAIEALATIDDVSVSVESGALICTEKQAVTANVANSATQATLDHAAFSVAVVAGDTLIISGHTGSAAHLAMNQEFIVKSVTSTTETVLTGSGMTAAGGGTSYSAGTIIVSKPAAPISVTFNTEHGNVPNLAMAAGSLTGTGAGLTLVTSQPGTTEDVECSNHGTCDRTTGVCECDPGWTSSDGSGLYGTKGDCGALISTASCKSQFCSETVRL